MTISIFDIKTHEDYLNNKENIEINDLYKGNNAFCVALLQKDYQRAQWLIHEGIDLSNDIDLFMHENITPEIQILMIEKGVGFDGNKKTLMGNSPLHYSKNKEVIKSFIKKGIPADILNDFGENALFKIDDPELLDYLIANGCAINHLCNNKRTAIFSRDEKVTEFLLKKGAKADILDIYGNGTITNVHSKKVFNLLVEHGASINFISGIGHNILMCNYDYNIDVDYCLSNGVDINHKDMNGENMLQQLTDNESDFSFAMYLIEKGIEYKHINIDTLPEKIKDYIVKRETMLEERRSLNIAVCFDNINNKLPRI